MTEKQIASVMQAHIHYNNTTSLYLHTYNALHYKLSKTIERNVKHTNSREN